jgi:hypothetical protein
MRTLIPLVGTACLLAALSPGGALPARAAPDQAVRPSITSFKLSRAALPSSGGGLTATVTVTHASSCKFSSTPGLHGLPATVGCAGGHASRKITLPANTSATAKTYTFNVTVTGPGGTVTSKPLTATVHGAKPAVTVFAAAPNGLTSAGGTTMLTATLVRSSTCVLSASPAVAGLPASFACAAGTTPKAISHSVSLPALTGSAAVPYTFTLTATGAGGTASAQTSQTVWPPMTFAAPASADPAGGSPDDVSCASATFCTAVDRFGNVFTFTGSKWSGPKRVESVPDGLVTGMNTAISCPTSSFCAELAQTGAASFFDGSAWSKPVPTGLGVESLSCASSSFCAAVGGFFAAVYTGTAWSSPVQLNTKTPLVSISCTSSSFCLAVSSGGDDFAYDGVSWSAGTDFDTADGDVTAVSCASQTMCVAVNDNGKALSYYGSSWTAPVRVVSPAFAGLAGVSCPSASFCMASGADGSYYTYDGSVWSSRNPLGVQPLGGVSCSSSSACVIIESNGTIGTTDGTTWTNWPVDPSHGFPQAISCATTTFCAAVDWFGAVAIYNGSTWNKARPIDPQFVFDSISCPTSSFCMAMELGGNQGSRFMYYNGSTWLFGAVGYDVSSVSCASATFCLAMASINASVYALTWNGTSWSSPALIDSAQGVSPPPGTGFVSCASPTFCAVADTGGNVLTFNGSSWSAPHTIDAGAVQPLAAISCPTTTFCTAIDGFGQAFTYNGSSWSGPAGVENTGGMTGISCASAQFCVAVDEQGNLDTFSDGTWSGPVKADPGVTSPYGFTGVSCPSVGFCQAVDFGGRVVTGTG